MEARSSHPTAGKWSPPQQASSTVKGIHAMLHPRNIVLVGATDKPGNYAERIWNSRTGIAVDALIVLNNAAASGAAVD
jgi:acetate---CoA ligase (ADP-forming)